MKEDFLHYCWKFKKFDFLNAQTTHGEALSFYQMGQHNQSQAGPDFFNAQLSIGNQRWAGNVELHVKASDWYAHHHETDALYDNVILHVVWEHDVEVFRKNNEVIPCLELKHWVNQQSLSAYRDLSQRPYDFIPCEKQFSGFEAVVVRQWLTRLYLERLEEKAVQIKALLETEKYDFETVLFQLLAKGFGLNKNGAAFLAMAQSIPFSVIRKQTDATVLEALFLGQVNLLNSTPTDQYTKILQKEYAYQKHKHQLSSNLHLQVHFFRLRPMNFPSIRLSQLAVLYTRHKALFQQLMKVHTPKEAYELLQQPTTAYWKTHYSLGKVSKSTSKLISKSFIDALLINVVVPLRFVYQQHLGNPQEEQCINFMQNLSGEQNAIVKRYRQLTRAIPNQALFSQALLQLHKNYCTPLQCLQCQLGVQVLQKTKT